MTDSRDDVRDHVNVPAPVTSAPAIGLMTDFYHVESAYVSWRTGRNPLSTFDLYTRHHPFGSAYLLVAGLQFAVEFATQFRYTDDDIGYLRTLRPFDEAFLSELRDLRFTGEILAMPEGEIAFAHDPLLRVTAPFRESLVLESALLHFVGVATLIATKAARIVTAAQGRPVADFGFRRAQAPMIASRSAYIGGCVNSSFLAAAKAFGLPTGGTIPHALIEVFATETEAFRAVAESLERYSLLLDTYDVPNAIRTAATIAREVEDHLGHKLVSVRLDSGDFVAESRMCRTVLDNAGLQEVQIVASGDLDEHRVAAIVAADAPIDGFGIGTSLAVGAGSVDHGTTGGALGAVYKLAWDDDDTAPIKLAGDKSTWPGKKRVVRIGDFERDVIALDTESMVDAGRALLQPVVRDGEIVSGGLPSVAEIRATAAANLAALPEGFRRIDQPEVYPVEWSEALRKMRDEAVAARMIRPGNE